MKTKALATAILLVSTNLAWAAVDSVFDARGLGIDETEQFKDTNPVSETKSVEQWSTDKNGATISGHDNGLIDLIYEDDPYGGFGV